MTVPATPHRWQRPAAGSLVARGREAEVFDVGDGAVLKLYREVSDGRRAAQEASVLTALRTNGLSVPRVIEEIVLDDRPGLVLERVAGPDMLTALGHRPWRVFLVGPALAKAQVLINDTPAPGQLPTMKARLRERIAKSRDLDAAKRADILQMLEAQDDGDRLCHGDLHLENLLGHPSQPFVIDWSNAAVGPPAADVARSLVILRFGEPPPDAPATVRCLAPALRRVVVSRYLASYRSMRPSYLKELKEWEIIQAAARLGETTQTESSLIRIWLTTAM